MIRLVTQFDDAETRASAATPTCGCSSCSCCCCCIATAISTSAYTAMNLRVHARELQEETGKSPSPWPEILGALVLALAILAVVGLAPIGLGVGALLVPVAAWLLILLGLYRWVGSEHPWRAALGTFLIGTVLAFIEFLVALVPVVSGRSGVVAYVVGAIVVAIIAIVVLYKRLLWRA